jgi:DNA-directed RNA polymerase subunit RPC12/RpoP
MKCPKCGSTNLIGSVDAEYQYEYDPEIDHWNGWEFVVPSNSLYVACKDCSHEWETPEAEWDGRKP